MEIKSRQYIWDGQVLDPRSSFEQIKNAFGENVCREARNVYISDLHFICSDPYGLIHGHNKYSSVTHFTRSPGFLDC